MRSLITSYLLQSKLCVLPGIGTLHIRDKRAMINGANSLLLPPSKDIVFRNDDELNPDGLIKYIADKKHIELSEVEELLNHFCKEWKGKLDEGEPLNLDTIGYIQKNNSGIIIFNKEGSSNFFLPIPLNNPYHKSSVPVLDKEPVLAESHEYPKEEVVIVERSYWGLWALILLAVGSVMAFYHFKVHGLSDSTIGNQHQYPVDSARATYIVPK